MRRSIYYIIIVLTVLLCSCGGTMKPSRSGGDTVRMRYARGLTIVMHEGYTEAIVANPWKAGTVLHRYLLVGDSAEAAKLKAEGVSAGADIVKVPLERSVVYTTAHCQLLEYLGEANRIRGVCDREYILIPDIQHRIKAGKIADCGNAMAPMIEKIIALNPDALFISPFENSGGYGKVEKLGVPIIEVADYMEPTALGRAEWMRFYGMLFGCEERADSLFNVVDSCYQQLKAQAKALPRGRSIITERLTGSVWYLPGGQSSVAQIIRDANGSYAFSDDKHSGSLALPFEQVLAKAGESDVWAFKYNGDKPMTKDNLLSEFHGYTALKAFRNGEIYECNCSRVPYFEEIPFRPDYLLREMILLLHPEVKGTLRYYISLLPSDRSAY